MSAPAAATSVGRIPTALLEAGVLLGPLWLLETRGRRSGRTRTVPIAVLRHGGERWLVSPFGDVAWVHNARADSAATLRRGRSRHPVELVETYDGPVPEVLRRYRRTFRAVPFVRAAFRAGPTDSLETFAAIAARHPVFRLVRARAA